MLESLLLPYLNTALSAVFEDLEPHQLYASILRGSLVLRDLKLKADALAPLSIPVDVTYGHVERLEIKLSLLRLLTEPIVVNAEDVLVVGTTQPPSAWNVEREELLRDQQRNLTLLTDECLTYAREESGLPSVLQRAAYAVIQRIRLSVNRLEVRLEDTETASGQHFAFGLRATRLFNVRCDSNWNAEGQPSTTTREKPQATEDGLPYNASQQDNSSELLRFSDLYCPKVACIFRWAHYAVILYQEVVSGVYAECLEVTPGEDEMENYRSAWRRHLVRYALSATNCGKALNLQIKPGQSTAAFTSTSCAEAEDWEAEEAADEKLIREFEGKYWPTVILPLRQLALQDLKQKVCRYQFPRAGNLSPQQCTVGGGAAVPCPTLEGGQPVLKTYSNDVNGLERIVASSINEAEASDVKGLVEEMAEEVSVASEAELQMIKCIQQMQRCRFSKSVQFAVQLYDLEVTLAAAYEAPACIRVKFDELYTHSAMYYDLRMQFVAAFEGVHVTDNMMPNLIHRRVLVSRPRPKTHTQAPRRAETCRGQERDTSTEASLSSYGCSSCGSKHIHGTPPLSPLQSVNTACILDWSTNCIRKGGCLLESSKMKEYEGEVCTNQEASAGGWIRFDKSYVPLEGIPDMRLYLQTHGSLLCTITPAAVAYLVEALQEPVHLVEGSSILEAASREVQDAIHRNELFLAQLLVGEVDHPTVDICLDIPAPHKLLIPVSHEISECRGVLIHSGVVSVDSRLKRPQQQPFASGHTSFRSEYDRYSLIITGACLQRVTNCQQVECTPSVCQADSCSPLKGRAGTAKRCSAASADIGISDGGLHNTPSSAGTKCTRFEKSGTSSAHRRHRETACESADNTLAMADRSAMYEAFEGTGRLGSSESPEGGLGGYILWPVGLTANIDVCNNLHSLTNLPAFAIVFQDQDFSGVCITLTDKDIVALTGFLAHMQALFQTVSPLWNAPPAVDDTGDAESISSTSFATLPSTERKESSSSKLHLQESFTATEKFQDRTLRGRRVPGIPRLHSSPAHRKTVGGRTSGGLSDFSGKGSIDSQHNTEKITPFRRVAFYINRSLRNPGVLGQKYQMHRRRTGHATLMPQAERSFADGEPFVLDNSISRNLQRVALGSNALTGGSSTLEKVENEGENCLAVESKFSEGALDENDNLEPSRPTQHITDPRANNGLIGFDVKLGLSFLEFRLYREEHKSALETIPTCSAGYTDSSTGTLPIGPGDSVLLRCSVGNSRIRLRCPAQSTRMACTAALDEVCVSLGWPAPADKAEMVLPEVRGGGHGWPKRMNGAVVGNKSAHRACCQTPNTSAQGCAARESGPVGHLSMASETCRACPRIYPFQQSWPTPLFQFVPPQFANCVDVEQAAADVATALSEAANSHGQPSSRMMLPTATVMALRRAFASKGLRVTTRWMFPPPYPGGRSLGDYRTLRTRDSPCEDDSNCNPVVSGRACGESSTPHNSMGGEAAEQAHTEAGWRVLSFGSNSHNKEAAEEEVLVEDLVGALAGKVACEARKAYAAATPRSARAKSANLTPAGRGSPLQRQSRGHASLDSDEPPAGSADNSDKYARTNWNSDSLDVVLFVQNGGKLPWRVRVSILFARFDVILPASSGFMTLYAVDGVDDSPASFKESKRNRGKEGDRPSSEDTHDLLEAVLATAPPVFVLSFSADTSFYSECREFMHADNGNSPAAEPEISQEAVRTTPVLHKTVRLLGNINQLRGELLEGRGFSESVLDHLVEISRKTFGILEPESAGRLPLGGCLRPAGFGAPELPPLTLLDGHRIARSVSCSTRKEWPAFSKTSQRSTYSVQQIPLTFPANQTRGFRASMHSNRNERAAYKTVLTVERHGMIDGCRCRVRAAYRIVGEPSCAPRVSGLRRTEQLPSDSMPELSALEKVIDPESTQLRCHPSTNAYRRTENYLENDGEAVVELEPLVVHLEPSVVAAGMSLLQLLQKLFLSTPPETSAVQMETPRTHTGAKEADGSVKTLEVHSAAPTTDLKLPRKSVVNGEQPVDLGVPHNCTHRQSSTAPYRIHQKDDAPRANATFGAESPLEGVGRVQSSFETAESSLCSSLAEGSGPTAGIPRALGVSEAFYQGTRGCSPASQGHECHSDSMNRVRAALEDTAGGGEEAKTDLSWLWALVNSLDAVLTLKVEMECIQFESPSLHFTVEDLEVRCGLEAEQGVYSHMKSTKRLRQRSAAGRFALKHISPEATTRRMPQELREGQEVRQVVARESTKPPLSPKDLPKGNAGKQKELFVGIKMMLSAEALHKERIALESVLEPWHCSVGIRYTPGDLLLTTLPAYPPGEKAAAEPRNYFETHGNYYLGMRGASDRSRKLQQLARIWGKHGTELCAEVYCSWLNVTAAPFLMDAVLDTANLIEAAQRALQEQLNKVNMTGLILLVHLPSQEQEASGVEGEESNSLMVDHHLVTDDFGITRRKAFATIPTPASNPSTTSESAGENGDNSSNSLNGSAYDDNRLTTLPGTQTATENKTGGWRSLCHGESFHVPLDDHGQTRKVIVRLQIAGSEFEIDDLSLDGSQVSLRELPIKLPALLNNPLLRDARKRQRHELLHASARILVRTVFVPSSRTFNTYLSSMVSIRNNLSTPVMVFPHPAIAVLDTPAEALSTASSSCSVDDRRSDEASKGPSTSSKGYLTTKGNTGPFVVDPSQSSCGSQAGVLGPRPNLSIPSNKASTDATGDPISSNLDQSTQANINNEETSHMVSTAMAVTVYGQSRDLVSESDPLFFEVGLNAPISLGNRLFEPLRVSVIPSYSATVQRHPPGVAAPDHHERLLSYARVAAGGDICVQRAVSGFVFELETTSCGSEYRHIYESKPLLIDFHAPAPSTALDLTVCFVRSRILDSSGNKIQQHSTMYRHLSRHQPAEFSVQAEVLGWVQQNAGSSSDDSCGSSSTSCNYAGLTNIKRHMWCTCVRMIRIFAPFWLINRQSEALVVSYCRRSVQYMPSSDWRLLGVPSQGKACLALGIAPDDETAHLCLQKDSISPALAEDIRAARARRGVSAKLSQAFRVDIVGRPTTVSVQMQTSGEAQFRATPKKWRHFGVTVALAPPPFSRSRIISIHSRFILKNCLPCDIWVRETTGNAPALRLLSGSQCPFHPQALGPRGEALICITKTDPSIIETLAKTDALAATQPVNSHLDGGAVAQAIEKVVWSSQLSVARSASLQIRLKTPVEHLLCSGGGINQHTDRGPFGKAGRALLWEHHNIHIAIRSLENAAYAVVFSEPVASEYLLVNNTNHIIAFAQSGIRTKHVWEILDRGSQVDYAWTDPQRERKSLRFSFWDQNQKVVKTCDIARVRLHRPLTLPNSKEKIYFVTDVRGSRRRVTVTYDEPSAPLKSTVGTRKVWKSLPHNLFKIRRKRVGQQQRRETKTSLLTRPNSQAGVLRSVRDGSKLTAPSCERQLLATGEADETAISVQFSQTGVPKEPLPQRKMLRFQKRDTLKLAFKLRGGTAACSAESSSGSSVFAEDALAFAETNAKSGSGESQGTEEQETLRQHRVTAFLKRRSVTNGTGSRSVRTGFKRRGNRRSYGLSQRTPVSSSLSEINQADEPCRDISFAEMGFYGGIVIEGFGISLVDPTPHELAFGCISGIRFEVGRLHKASGHDIRFSIKSLQIDNGVPGAQHRTILRHATVEERMERHEEGKLVISGDGLMASGNSDGLLCSVARPTTEWNSLEESQMEDQNLFFRIQLGGEWRDEATLLDYVDVELTPIAVHVEADTTSVLLRFLMQLIQDRTFFLMSLQEHNIQLVQDAAANKATTSGYQQLRALPQATVPVAASLKPLYIHELAIRPMLIIFSTRSQRLQRGHATSGSGNVMAIRQFEILGDRMTDITNFPMKSRLLAQQCVFTNAEQLVADIGYSYIQQCIWQLHKLVASIDVIGNPLRLITGVSSSLRLVTAHRSDGASNAEPKTWRAIHCVSTLVLNVASEFFTSISNIAGGFVKLLRLLGLTDVQGILSVWPESIRVPRARFERPETFLEGIYAGCIGFVQLLGGSILALRDIYDKTALESGIWRFCTGTAQRIAFVLAAPAVSIFVFVSAVAAGLSSALRHKSAIEKTRPRRVFPPEMTVSQYRFHTARAMNLLEKSTRKSLVPGMLQSGIISFPLPQTRSLRSHRQHHGEENKGNNVNNVRDYLLVTSDFVICLRDGKPQWVCRKEDIQECTVNMPAYVVGALLAQQDLFVRNRERPGGVCAYEDVPRPREENERAPHDSPSLCVVHVKVANQLKLPEDVLHNFTAAYKAYLHHATTKRSVVQALRDNFKVHFGGTDPSIIRNFCPSQTRSQCHQNTTAGTEDTDGVPLLVEAMACNLPSARNMLPRSGKLDNQRDDNQDIADDGKRQDLQMPRSQHKFPFLGLQINWKACCRRKRSASTQSLQRGLAGPSSWAWWEWLRSLRRRKPPAEPEAVTLTIRAPDRDAALQIFDALCSTTESYIVARRGGGDTGQVN
ncbi:AGAP005082-PA, related, related [Eimeria praecox]|uniref:AGAP005082-PA, related, related n=1 Tax=Eimeria praecox TaxID=51316 RepID=U6GGE3_9EIME|nr:AGAP005082-PA, related, related [Eimeria praecox]